MKHRQGMNVAQIGVAVMGTIMEGPWNLPDSISGSSGDNYTVGRPSSELFLVKAKKGWALYCLQRLKEKTLQASRSLWKNSGPVLSNIVVTSHMQLLST